MDLTDFPLVCEIYVVSEAVEAPFVDPLATKYSPNIPITIIYC